MGKYLKIKKVLTLVVSKPRNFILRCKTAIKIALEFSGKKRHSFIADPKLQVDQNKRRVKAKFNEQLLI